VYARPSQSFLGTRFGLGVGNGSGRAGAGSAAARAESNAQMASRETSKRAIDEVFNCDYSWRAKSDACYAAVPDRMGSLLKYIHQL
jgi:hypothetical protein